MRLCASMPFYRPFWFCLSLSRSFSRHSCFLFFSYGLPHSLSRPPSLYLARAFALVPLLSFFRSRSFALHLRSTKNTTKHQFRDTLIQFRNQIQWQRLNKISCEKLSSDLICDRQMWFHCQFLYLIIACSNKPKWRWMVQKSKTLRKKEQNSRRWKKVLFFIPCSLYYYFNLFQSEFLFSFSVVFLDFGVHFSVYRIWFCVKVLVSVLFAVSLIHSSVNVHIDSRLTCLQLP